MSRINEAEAEKTRSAVRASYARVALSGAGLEIFQEASPADASASSGCCGPSASSPAEVAATLAESSTSAGCGCCGGDGADDARRLAEALGYAADDLSTLPAGANMGLSCGNPVALGALNPGEVVVDLGAGGGFDVFQAARRVGATGRAIGVDMTPEMVGRARRNLAEWRSRSGQDNAEFRLGEIEALPVADASADVVLSNCVVNLSPDKARVWREVARVLKPGGRVAISDVVLKRPLPSAFAADLRALAACVAGASLLADVERDLRAAGLVDIAIAEKPAWVETMGAMAPDLWARLGRMLPEGTSPADFVASVDISARKPA